MSRNQVRFVIGLVIVCLLGGLGYRLGAGLWLQRQGDQELPAFTSADADQRMQNFQRIKMRGGKKIWEIAATQARFFEDRRELLVDSPAIALYLDSGEVFALQCQEGRVYLDESVQEIVLMKLRGDIEMQIGELSLKTQTALYDSAQNTISAPDTVHIVGQGLYIEALGYQVAMNEKQITLHAKVHTTLAREEG